MMCWQSGSPEMYLPREERFENAPVEKAWAVKYGPGNVGRNPHDITIREDIIRLFLQPAVVKADPV